MENDKSYLEGKSLSKIEKDREEAVPENITGDCIRSDRSGGISAFHLDSRSEAIVIQLTVIPDNKRTDQKNGKISEEAIMNRKSITQEYYTLVVDKYGVLPSMHREESGAGLVAAAFMDLLSADIITEDKKKIIVVKDIPDELKHLEPLYIYLKEKQRSVNKMMTDWHAGARCRQLMESTGKSLIADGLAAEEPGGMFRPKKVYIPVNEYKEELNGILKAAVIAKEEMRPEDMALLCILKESKNLNQYFSKDERDELRRRIEEIKEDPQNKALSEMIRYITYVEDLTAYVVIAATMAN